MVGYKAYETMTPNEKLIAGCIAGVATRFITQPMDVIKLRTQLQKQSRSKNRNIFRTSYKIFNDEGLTAFWHGHSLGQFHSILAVSCQFYVYELTTRSFKENYRIEKKYRAYVNFMCGIFAGCCSATLVNPLEVIRVRQMIVHNQYKGLFKGAKNVYKTGGILAFCEGLSASLLMMGPQVGISFGVFGFIQPKILSYFHDCSHGKCKHETKNVHKPEHLLIASSIAGSAAGLVSKTLTYPLDLAKRRLQIGSHKESSKYKLSSTTKRLVRCKTLRSCIVNAYEHEGLRGLYRGWSVTVYKAQLTNVVAFTTYELVCYAITEMKSE